jgi:hypothetical protein
MKESSRSLKRWKVSDIHHNDLYPSVLDENLYAYQPARLASMISFSAAQGLHGVQLMLGLDKAPLQFQTLEHQL